MYRLAVCLLDRCRISLSTPVLVTASPKPSTSEFKLSSSQAGKVKRKSQYYVVSVLGVMLGISSLVFTAESSECGGGKVGARLQN